MPHKNCYFVYIVASRSRNLYTGVTYHLERRVSAHRQGIVPGFTKRYRIHRLVYYETFGDIRGAIEREKQIKSWRRQKKVALIERDNPTWADLAAQTLDLEKSKADPSPQPPRHAQQRHVPGTPASRLGMTAPFRGGLPG